MKTKTNTPQHTKKTLPTKETFKEEAKNLLKKNDNISSHTEALDLLAVEYGSKNYATIKPLLKNSIFPLSRASLSEYMDKYLYEAGVREGGEVDYFLQRSFLFWNTLADIFFAYREQPYIKNKDELASLQTMMRSDTILIELKKIMMQNPLSSLGNDLMVLMSEEIPNIRKIITRDIKANLEWARPFDEIYREERDGFQQLSYFSQSSTFFFLSLGREAMDNDYYSNLKKYRDNWRKDEDKKTVQFIDDLEAVLKTAWLYENLDDFLGDIKNNKPIDERIYTYDLLSDTLLSVLFENKSSFYEPVMKLKNGGTMEDVTVFLDYITNLHIEEERKSLGLELKRKKKQSDEVAEVTSSLSK